MSNVLNFGARGDGICDDTEAIRRTLAEGDGTLKFPKGDYLVTRTIRVELSQSGRMSLEGTGGTAKVLMAGAGPAFHIVGTHTRSADPEGFEPGAWSYERMPTVSNLEVGGRHPESDGFLLEGTMQSTFEGVLLRDLNDGIRLHGQTRNVLVSHCHIYNNRGAGVFLDRVNLHQIIVIGSHISYCKRGGIKVIGSQIRNLQITGNDIEYNFDDEADRSADIWIDTSDGSTVREGTISGNTIQAKRSPGGANILMIGHGPQANNKVGMFTISGNLIGTQEDNIRLIAGRGIVISGNVIYNGFNRNLLVEGAQNIVVGANSFDHNPDYGPERSTGVQFVDSADCTLNGSTLHEFQSGQNLDTDDRQGLLEIVRCRRITVNGCQILDGYPSAIYVADSEDISITGCTLLETRDEKETVATVCWKGAGSGNLLSGNRIGKGTQSALSVDEPAGVQAGDNLVDEG